MLLQYNYAVLDANDCCGGVVTYSIEVPLDNHILIPEMNNDYMYKYYNRENQMWYWDAEFTQLWEECPSHNV
jgi:hypothetical protein